MRPAHTRFLLLAVATAAACLSASSVTADPFPPWWNGGNGPAVHHAPAAWPAEPANAADCGHACGEWKPYTRFQNSLNDPRVKDPSNGGTSPQNYVNIASSCIDKDLPSIYYSLHRGAAADGSQDVLMFRWRVEQIANTYATGPNPGTFGATHPWNSALWTVLFDLDGSGFRDLAAHLNGSSGSPGAQIDLLAGIWGNIPTQSINYLTDPNIHLLGHNPTAFVDGPGPIDGGSNRILNFQNSLTPSNQWPNGSSETTWDYGTSRARLVSKNSCTEYFIDYQIPIALLDASSLGGPRITRSTPISMLFCTANSLNNPFQKDCAINKAWAADSTRPAPFGDYLSFDKEEPYAQPIISKVTATGPATCPGSYHLEARVQDTLHLANGVIVPSVRSVDFYYWHDVDGDGTANEPDGQWVRITPTATLKAGTVNTWQAAWNATSLARGKYLIGAQAVDDNGRLDDDMVATGVDNRTFSYLSGNADNEIFIDGSWRAGQQALFPGHAPAQSPSATENWYGNPDVTGQQIALIGVAINACGVAPTLGKTASPTQVATGETVEFTLTLANLTSDPLPLTALHDLLPDGFEYVSTTSIVNGAVPVTAASAPSAGAMGEIEWTFAGVVIAAGQSALLQFVARAGNDAGTFNNTASAQTGFGALTSPPATIGVDAARISLSKTPDRYNVNPDGTTVVTWTMRWSNDSAVTLAGATISDALPANINYVSCAGAPCSHAAGTVTWTLGTLAPGASGEVTLGTTVAPAWASPSLTNTATLAATAPGGGTVTREASATISVNVPVPAFTLEKTSSAVQVAPGGTVTWTIAYRNFGSGAASGALITDTLPAGSTFVGCAQSGGHFSATCTHANGVVTFHNGAGAGVGIPAGASGTVTITTTLGVSGNPFTFQNPAPNLARITWTGNPTGQSAQAEAGVTGQFCSAVYFFRRGADNDLATLRPATVAAPDATSQYSTAIPTITNTTFDTTNQIVFESPVLAQSIDVSNQTLTVNFVLQAAQGGARTQAVLERVNASNVVSLLRTSGELQVNNGTNQVVFTAVMDPGTVLQAGERLRWRFQFRTSGGTRDLTFLYDSTLHPSRSSFCVASAPANLTLAKTVNPPQLQTVPGALVYTIRYANAGGTTASGVQVVDTLPAGVSFNSATLNGSAITPSIAGQTLTFAVPNLVAGASATLVINATAGASASGTLTNTATVSATSVPSASDTADTIIGPLGGGGTPPSVSVAKRADRTLLGAGDAVTYTLTVVNTGGSAATGVVVTDDFPQQPWFAYTGCSTASGSCSQAGGVLTWNVGTLAAGSAATLTLQMQAATTGIPAGVTLLDNVATVVDADHCTGGSPPASCTSETVTVTVSGQPRLALAKSVSPTGPHSAGDVLTYTLTVSNTGSSSASGVVVADPIRPYTQFAAFASANPVAGRFDAVDNRVVFDVGTLAAGASQSLSFDVVVQATLPAGATPIVNLATASAGNAPTVDDSVATSANAAPVLEVAKSGPASHPYPAASLSAAASASDTVTVADASRLTPGQTVRIGGTLRQIVAIAGRTLTLSGAVTADSGAAVESAALYALTFRNTGAAVASNAVVSDVLPAGLVFVSASPAATTAPAVGSAGTVSWAIGALAPGETGVVQVTALPVQTGTLANAARISATEDCAGGLPPARCVDSVSTAVGGLVVAKSTSTPTVAAGSTASYRIEVVNTRAVAATGVVITDVLPAGFTFASTTQLTIDGNAAAAGIAPSAGAEAPAWGTFSIPGNGVLVLEFVVDVATSVGTGTYDNPVDVVSTNSGVIGYDEIARRDEDVTVLGIDSGLVDGIVYRDIDANGSFDPAIDVPVAGATVELMDGNEMLFVATTDDDGYFRRVITPGNVWVDLDPADVPPGTDPTFGADGALPGSLVVPAGGRATRNIGFVASGMAVAIAANDDAWGPVNGIPGDGHLGSVFANDTLDSLPVQDAQVLASIVGSLPAGLTFDVATGVVGVQPGTPAGSHVFTYRICQASTPANCDTATVTVLVALPALVFDKLAQLGDSVNANGTGDAGEVIDYVLTATNSGGLTLTDVTITDPRLPMLACVQPATLAPGQSLQCTGSYMITQGDVDQAQPISNTATATAVPPGSATLVATDSALVPVTGMAPAIALVKTAQLDDSVIANGTADAGETITYTLAATNIGGVTLSGVSIDDPRLPALACTPSMPATLAPGATLTCTGSLGVSQGDIDAGVAIVNLASASGTPPSGPPVTATDTTTTPVTGGTAAITLVKAAQLVDEVIANGSADAGETIHYTLTAHNSGAQTLSGVSIVDPRLPSLACTPTMPAVLPPAAALQCSGSYTVTQADVDAQAAISNTATVTAMPPSGPVLTATDTAVVAVTGMTASIALVKTAQLDDSVIANGTADAGETITYTLAATNIGGVTLSGVSIDDPRLPALACTPSMPATLAPGATLTCTGSLGVSQGDIDAGVAIVNLASASGTPPSGPPVTATDTTTTPVTGGTAAITLVKAAQLVDEVIANGSADAGETIHYTLTAHNSGAQTLSGVSIDDPRLPSLACTPTMPAVLPPAAALQCSGSYTVTQADVDAQAAISNTATVTATPPSGPALTAADTAVVPVTAGVPAIRLLKTATLLDDVHANGLADAGETLGFVLVATNTGGTALSGVTIVDPMLAALACTPALPATLAPGASLQCSGSHVVTAAEVAAGVPIVNVATATGTPPVGAPVSDDDSTSTPVATPVQIPQIGVAKRLASMGGSGPYDLRFDITVVNTGSVALDQVQVIENLRQTFPLPSAFTVTSLTATGSVQANPAFDGNGNDGLLVPAASTLAVGASATISLRVRLVTHGATGPFANIVQASGRSPLDEVVSDASTDGMSPTPGEQGPTPIVLPSPPTAPVTIPVGGGGVLLIALLVMLTARRSLRGVMPSR